MLGILKLCVYFSISLIILSVQYESKPLFYKLHQYSGPITVKLIGGFKNIFEDFISETGIEKNIMNKKKIDEISSSLSSVIRKEFRESKDLAKRKSFFHSNEKEPHHHHYEESEQNELRKILERE